MDLTSNFHALKRKEFANKFMIYLILLVLIIIVSVIEPKFLSFDNIINLLRQVSIYGLLALGALFIIISKGIDLSAGSVVALSAVFSASFAQSATAMNKFYPDLGELSLFIPLFVGIAIGLICGLINGMLVAYTGIPAFIATLGAMVFLRGVTWIYTDGKPISFLEESFEVIGKGSLFDLIPIPILIFLFFVFVSWIYLTRTKFGKSVYAIGGNINAAIVSGIHVKKNLILVYMYSGLLYGIAGVVLTSRVGSGQPGFGSGYELDAIAAATIGGTSHGGGIGTVSGTFAGILILGVISNGLNFLGVSAYWQQIVKAIIIVGAVIVDTKKYSKKT